MKSLAPELIDRISSFLDRRDLKCTLLLYPAFQVAAENHSGAFADFSFNNPRKMTTSSSQNIAVDVCATFATLKCISACRHSRPPSLGICLVENLKLSWTQRTSCSHKSPWRYSKLPKEQRLKQRTQAMAQARSISLSSCHTAWSIVSSADIA